MNNKKTKIYSTKNNYVLYYNNEFINEFVKLPEERDIYINDLESSFELDQLNIIKLIYYNRTNIHKILYEKQLSIIIDGNIDKISFYYYLILLIKENNNINNYIYSFEYIKKINEKQKNNNNLFNKIIYSKIIIDLINELDENDEKLKSEIIENENLKIIEDNINIFNKLGLNWNKKYIISNEIDKIYLEIKKALVQKNVIIDFEQILNIINQLDLENIYNIEEISNIFNKNEKYIKDYLISENNDLLNITKISFYYDFLKNIIKNNSIYIYNIKFLLKTKIFIIKLINSKSNILIDDNIKEKFEYILKIISDSKYYIEKYNEIKLKNNKKGYINEDININKLKLNLNGASNNTSFNSMIYKNHNNLNEQNNSESQTTQKISDYNSDQDIKKDHTINKQDKVKSLKKSSQSSYEIDNNCLIGQSSSQELNFQSKTNSNYSDSRSNNLFKKSVSYDNRIDSYQKSKNEDNKENEKKIDYQIIKYIKKMGNHKKKKIDENNNNKQNITNNNLDKKFINNNKIYTADSIIKIGKYFLSFGINNTLIFYDEYCNIKRDINNLNLKQNYIINICEFYNNVIICQNDKLRIYDLKKFEYKNVNSNEIYEHFDNYILFLLKMS